MKSSGLVRDGQHFVAGDGDAGGTRHAAFHLDEAQLAGIGDAALGTGRLLPRPRELHEELDRTFRLHPMPHFRDDDCARRRIDPERAVERRADVIAQHPADHMDPGPDPRFCGVLGREPGWNRRFVELRRPAIGDASLGPFHPVAAHAVERRAEHRLASSLTQDPRAIHEGRTVPHMLAVDAIEIRHPVAVLVKVKADDRAPHRITVPAVAADGVRCRIGCPAPCR